MRKADQRDDCDGLRKHNTRRPLMSAYDFVQLAMLAHGGPIKGKTKLQKTMYFLGVLSGQAKDLGFRPHYYGPFSPAVAEAIDDLRGLGFVDESVASIGSVDASGFEVARHDFSLNKDGRSVADANANKQPKEYQKIREAVKKFAKVEHYDYEKV